MLDGLRNRVQDSGWAVDSRGAISVDLKVGPFTVYVAVTIRMN